MLAGAMSALKAGSKIHNYRILNLLGQGGMGAVYKVENTLNGTTRALKMMDPLFARGELLKRFDREVNVLTRFNHRNVVGVTDHGVWNDGAKDIPYYVMESLSGRDLSDHIKARPHPAMSLQETLPILMQVMDALEYAHGMGVVHRDLKPANIFISDGDPLCVKLLDFGIAKCLEGSEAEDTLMTQDGMGLGTIDYMSPEQALKYNSKIDARTDIWALGAIMFVMLSGKKPFTGKTGPEVMVNISTAKAPPRLDAVMDNVPIGMQGIIDRTLHPKRSVRFASVNELSAALKSLPLNGTVPSHSRTAATMELSAQNTFVDSEITPTRTITMTPKRRSRAGLWLTLTFLALSGGVGGAYYLGQPDVVKLVNRVVQEGGELLKELRTQLP